MVEFIVGVVVGVAAKPALSMTQKLAVVKAAVKYVKGLFGY